MGLFDALGGAASDIFSGMAAEESGSIKAEGMRIKAKGTLAEAENYDLAAGLARQNKAFTAESFAIQGMQKLREVSKVIGGQQADIAGAGMAASGSALDILRESASQGALAKEALSRQGLIQEAAYDEQDKSFQLMAKTGRETAAAEMQLADRVQALGEQEAVGKYISSGFKIAGAVASLPSPAGG